MLLVGHGRRHHRPLRRRQLQRAPNRLSPYRGLDLALNRRVPFEHLVLLAAGAHAHALVERPDHPEFAGVAGLSRRGLDYRIVGEQQSGRDVIGAGELVSLLPQRLGHGEALMVLADGVDVRYAQPGHRMLPSGSHAGLQRIPELLVGPSVLALHLQLALHLPAQLNQQFDVQCGVIAPVPRQRPI